MPATVYDLDLAARLLGLPDDRRCDFLLSFGYPADPATLSAPNRAGGRVTLEEVVRETMDLVPVAPRSSPVSPRSGVRDLGSEQ